MDIENARPLGPEMIAEKWIPIGGDHITWMHAPSKRVVVLDGPIRFDQCIRIPALPSSPEDSATEGYVVSCYVWDEKAEMPGDGECFWVESYASALRAARKIRQSILDERPLPTTTTEQIALFREEG